MNKKILAIVLCLTLLIATTVLPVVLGLNESNNKKVNFFNNQENVVVNFDGECDPSIEFTLTVSEDINGPWYSYLHISPPTDLFFKIHIKNVGDDPDLHAFFIKEELPDGVDFIADVFHPNVDEGEYITADHTITWYDISIEPSFHQTLIIKVNIDEPCAYKEYENFAWIKYTACDYPKLSESDTSKVFCCNDTWICIPSNGSNTKLSSGPSSGDWASEINNYAPSWTTDLVDNCDAKWLWNDASGMYDVNVPNQEFKTYFDIPLNYLVSYGKLKISADDWVPKIYLNTPQQNVGIHGSSTGTGYTYLSEFELNPNWFIPGTNTLTVEVDDNYKDRVGGIWCLCLCLYKKPDVLKCGGTLRWSDITPGSTATGFIEISNIDEEESTLNWEIVEYPKWGKWSFLPESGTNLTSEDGPVEVEVEVEVPDEKNAELNGEVKIVNVENEEDYEIIPVSLSTSKEKDKGIQISILNLLNDLFMKYPGSFPLLRKILGL